MCITTERGKPGLRKEKDRDPSSSWCNLTHVNNTMNKVLFYYLSVLYCQSIVCGVSCQYFTGVKSTLFAPDRFYFAPEILREKVDFEVGYLYQTWLK